jgi:hypothetical protein
MTKQTRMIGRLPTALQTVGSWREPPTPPQTSNPYILQAELAGIPQLVRALSEKVDILLFLMVDLQKTIVPPLALISATQSNIVSAVSEIKSEIAQINLRIQALQETTQSLSSVTRLSAAAVII